MFDGWTAFVKHYVRDDWLGGQSKQAPKKVDLLSLQSGPHGTPEVARETFKGLWDQQGERDLLRADHTGVDWKVTEKLNIPLVGCYFSHRLSYQKNFKKHSAAGRKIIGPLGETTCRNRTT